MEKTWIIAIVLFIVLIFLFWKLTHRTFKQESKLVYWQVAIYATSGITILILYLLKWTDILTFPN